MNDLEGALLFAGIPIGTVALVWALVFGSTKKSKSGPAAGFSRPVTRSSSSASSGSVSRSDGDEGTGA